MCGLGNDYGDRVGRRFWDKVRIGDPNECWPWTGAKDRAGRGRFTVKGKVRKAHDVASALYTGQASTVEHRCGDPSCCNPRHLRHRPAKGSPSRLTGAEAGEVGQLLQEGITTIDIAHVYDVPTGAIDQIAFEKRGTEI